MIVKSEGQRDQMFCMYLLVNQEAFDRGMTLSCSPAHCTSVLFVMHDPVKFREKGGRRVALVMVRMHDSVGVHAKEKIYLR